MHGRGFYLEKDVTIQQVTKVDRIVTRKQQ